MTKTSALFVISLLSCAAAYPGLTTPNALRERTEPAPRQPLFNVDRPTTIPTTFNADDQYVDTSDGGEHPFIAPGRGDTRGQCPALNAAANHGFISRNGLVTITEAVEGLGKAYNMAPDFILALAVPTIAASGDPVTQTFSIGSPFTPSLPLFPATGLLGTHNKIEGDASITRGDAYLNKGLVNVFEMERFERVYGLTEKHDNSFNFAAAANSMDHTIRWSIENNPYYFSGPVTGFVAPIAQNLVSLLFANHNAENPGGATTTDILKSFYSVTGEPGSFVYTIGSERIPLDWHRRPTPNMYTLLEAFSDLIIDNSAYPGVFRVGGNTGTVNSFTGLDLQNLTDGVFNAATLTQGNNAACFVLQASLAVLPDAATPALGGLGSVLNWATSLIAPIQERLACPQLKDFNNELFNQFPGAGSTSSQ